VAGFSITQNLGLHSDIILWHSITSLIHSSSSLGIFAEVLTDEKLVQGGLQIIQ
jgi:hypothetical protein